MTNQSRKKVHRSGTNLAAVLVVWAAGVGEALLLGRLIARLLAARPDNPAIMILYGITGPIVTPLAALDYDQPPYGAALEFSTLAVAILVPLLAYLAWLLLTWRNSDPRADV
ncbi:MAG: YggT family protein [Chloroflexales bacterium]|nr:YggT family protein [Chloroflexales bacterium]